MKLIKKHWLSILLLLVLGCTAYIDLSKAYDIVIITKNNILTMLSFVPPIFILIGLLDVFIPREVMIKHMGPDSGFKGFIYAFLLGGLAAGPLYMAFPISAILLKKDAHLRYVVFFLGIWSTLKLPILLYEFRTFGFVFTMTNIVVAIVFFFIGAFLFEVLLSNKEKLNIKEQAVAMLDEKK